MGDGLVCDNALPATDLVFALVLDKTGSILASFTMHSAMNITGIALKLVLTKLLTGHVVAVSLALLTVLVCTYLVLTRFDTREQAPKRVLPSGKGTAI